MGLLFVGRLLLAGVFLVILFLPAWWLAGRFQERAGSLFFRFLCAGGLALIGYISFVNLVGRVTNRSITTVLLYLGLNAAVAIVVRNRWPDEASVASLRSSWREWIAPVLIAVALAIPQWLLAVSTNLFDEAASSAIHLTAANQFAEGLFPPRHNALPYISIKYHYGFTILSGTVRWLTGLSPNVSVDVVSTFLWLFIFLFAFFWLRQLDFNKVSALWGGFALLLGGSLAWLYMPRIEAYNGIEKVPPPSALIHRYDPAKGWLDNLLAGAGVPSFNLRNADGSLSSLPWEIGAQFQQHAVALGIALTLVALYLFVTWQQRKDVDVPLLIANIVTFGVLFLAHAVFGTVAAVSVALCLLVIWLRQRTRVAFFRGLFFGIGMGALALSHGGLLARGAQYGVGAATTLRDSFGYSAGGLSGFINWNIAGFGLPLILTVVAWCLWPWQRAAKSAERRTLFMALTVFAVISWLVPQIMFYSSEGAGVEQFTEISKFFFVTHFAIALLSVFAVAWISRKVHWAAVLPGFAAMAITPIAFSYAGSFNAEGKWVGFYRSPYFRNSIEQQMADTLGKLKTGNRDVYFDASADERRHDYLSEMLIFGGSVFTLTPSRYERTGIGYRLSEGVVARRFVQNGRMSRLLPGAAEDCRCKWYYARPLTDMAFAPVIVRSRFEKAVAEGYFRKVLEGGPRVLYAIDKPTADLDENIEYYWRPRVVSQPSRRAGATDDLIFYNYANKRIINGSQIMDLPEPDRVELVQVNSARFPGDAGIDLLVARMDDTYFKLGEKIEDVVEQSSWAWSLRDSRSQSWLPEYEQWLWDWDVPFIVDLDNDGFDTHVAYRPRTKEWLSGSSRLNGPKMDQTLLPLPIGGRFLEGSSGDLGLWSLRSGLITLKSVAGPQTASFTWGGKPGDILVNGDYDGDGYDEIAVWQRENRTWYWKRAPEGTVSQVTFGTDTSVPVPADYNRDGRLDLAYWEPRQQKIFVSYNQGRSIDQTITVPQHSIPAFVNMY